MHLYPEVHAGGFTRHDGFIEFYFRANALIADGATVLDFGAGRGVWADDGELPATHVQLRDFHRRGATVIGTDVDPAVLENPSLDHAFVVGPGEPLPLDDASIDLVIADHVLEHVTHEDALIVASEIRRVLRPGGWFAARTPNKWGMIAFGARLVPNSWHVRALRRLQPGRQAVDVFPTRYAMNARKDLQRLFPAPHWHLLTYGHASEPRYAGDARAAWRAASFVDRLTPPRLLPTLMVFAQKQ